MKMKNIIMGQLTIDLLWCGDHIVSKSFSQTKDKSFVHNIILGESFVHQGPYSLT